ncbi:hypothetical protein [Variovorax sp. GB1P17]|uniref:hypothetical protein n=1 Tax=Variovorax sp. GB1P17 TaxID=3443740 RepID=UPI003F48A13B
MRPSIHHMIHAAALALAGCAGVQPLAPSGARPSAQSCPDTAEEDREALTQYMNARLSDRLDARFSLVTHPGAWNAKADSEQASNGLIARVD